MNTEVFEQPEIGVIDDIGYPTRVILFNDEWHSFEDVIEQLIKALGCPRGHAEELTMEVHTTGKAAVFEGELQECLRVSSVLEEISLHTQIEC
jgi:ATP-dependent Clp protease adaptor protein ClpS